MWQGQWPMVKQKQNQLNTLSCSKSAKSSAHNNNNQYSSLAAERQQSEGINRVGGRGD